MIIKKRQEARKIHQLTIQSQFGFATVFGVVSHGIKHLPSHQ
jgi:hypothetical protein